MILFVFACELYKAQPYVFGAKKPGKNDNLLSIIYEIRIVINLNAFCGNDNIIIITVSVENGNSRIRGAYIKQNQIIL